MVEDIMSSKRRAMLLCDPMFHDSIHKTFANRHYS